MPILACFDAGYGIMPGAATYEFTDPRLTIEPRPRLLVPGRQLSLLRDSCAAIAFEIARTQHSAADIDLDGMREHAFFDVWCSCAREVADLEVSQR